MEPQTYSAFADLLSKFHTSSEWIQALWLIMVPAAVFSLAMSAVSLVRAILAALPMRRREPSGELIYSIYRDRQGGLLVYRHDRIPVAPEEALLIPRPDEQ
jgi:hypothetical protein